MRFRLGLSGLFVLVFTTRPSPPLPPFLLLYLSDDYTLAQYSNSLKKLIYNMARER